jgi:hypothetical protein
MRRRIRQRTFTAVVSVIFLSVFGGSIYSGFRHGRRSSHISVDYTENSSHFTISMKSKSISRFLPRLSLALLSNVANFSATFSQIPDVLLSSNHLTFTLFVPMTGEFTLEIHDTHKTRPIYSRHISSTSFMDPGRNYTKLACFGESYVLRYCYAFNICLGDSFFEFLLPYNATFEPVFFVPGARPPPFDPIEFRVTNEMIRTSPISNRPFSAVPAFFASRYYNARMLWHNVMDSLFPMYWTMTTFAHNLHNSSYGNFINRTNEILLFDTFGPTALFFLKGLSDHSLVLLSRAWPSKCFRRIVLGLRKNERAVNLNRGNRELLLLPYEIDPIGVRGLRKEMLEFSGTTLEQCKPSTKTPVVLIVHRKSDREVRRILNPDAVLRATTELCPHCAVSIVDFQQFDKTGQVRYSCNASVLIGVHGSGLIHAAWMHLSTDALPAALVELLPYKYTCRNWYKQYAKMLGIEYFGIQTMNVSQSRWEMAHAQETVERCHTDYEECFQQPCHDFLRDQSIVVDIDQYKRILWSFFKRFNS